MDASCETRRQNAGNAVDTQAGETESLENLTDNLARVRERVRRAAERAGRSPDEVTIVAVTKGVDAPTVQAALGLGVTDIGENRVQEARAKVSRSWTCPPGVRRHMIGHLQTNKVRHALALVRRHSFAGSAVAGGGAVPARRRLWA